MDVYLYTNFDRTILGQLLAQNRVVGYKTAVLEGRLTSNGSGSTVTASKALNLTVKWYHSHPYALPIHAPLTAVSVEWVLGILSFGLLVAGTTVWHIILSADEPLVLQTRDLVIVSNGGGWVRDQQDKKGSIIECYGCNYNSSIGRNKVKLAF